MAYATIDIIPDLTGAQTAGATKFNLGQAANSVREGVVNGAEPNAISHGLYSLELGYRTTVNFIAASALDPFQLTIYDSAGNAIATNTEATETVANQDAIYNWIAPYRGNYYVYAGWNQGSGPGLSPYSLVIQVNLGTSEFGNHGDLPPSPSFITYGSETGDAIYGGFGADTIIALGGNDLVYGRLGDDDVNGNQGDDQVWGDSSVFSEADGADTVRGGQGNDTVYGDGGDDPHVNGNLGDDKVYGGRGNDTVYGGKGNDTVYGDSGYATDPGGNDLISGDAGNDVLYGGGGADRFVMKAGFGADWVNDFNQAEGDRIVLAPGTAYTLTTYQGQVIIDLGGGDQLGLSAVTALTDDWLIYAVM